MEDGFSGVGIVRSYELVGIASKTVHVVIQLSVTYEKIFETFFKLLVKSFKKFVII